ncbi:MAG TPA: carboxypeptidase regulatory-like domain-containing protein [Gemmatimonadaceae bacterium]|jgi:hypothetical protein
MIAPRQYRWIAVLAFPLALGAQVPDAVHGHIRSEAGAPIAGAAVTVTSPSGATTRPVRTDSGGTYQVGLEGAGPFQVRVTIVGFAPQGKPVPAAVNGARPDVDFILAPVAQQLAAVVSRATRPRADRADRDRAEPGESGARADLTGAVGGDLSGDIAAAMGTVPGLIVTADPNGGLPTISAFGLSSSQNTLTLNGMNFGGGSVPRDGLVLRVAQSTYDPGRGGFSGVQTVLRLPSGTNYLNQLIHVTEESPMLQGSTPSSAQLGTQYSRQIVSGSWSGPIAVDKAFYSSAFQVSRRASDLSSLASGDAASLQALGVSADSVSRLLRVSSSLGIPQTTTAIPSDRVTTTASVLSRFDWSPAATRTAGSQLYMVIGGNYNTNAAANSSPLALASHGSDANSWALQAQGTSSRYFGAILNEANAAFVTSQSSSAPYLFLPDARILVASSFPDGTAGSSTVRVGGNSNAESDSRTSSAELRNETSWLTFDGRHNFKITLDGRVDHSNSRQSANRLGTFTFNSPADFASNTPSTFTRTLSPVETSGMQYLGALGLGDIYRPVPQLRIQYGLRVEDNSFGNLPSTNPLVASDFGRNTSHVPQTTTVAPMVGFTRQYSARHGGAFTGGIREYVGTLSSQTVQNVVRQTGLPDAVQQLTCIGSAVPTPVWSSYAASESSIPSTCANGSPNSFSQTTPPVTVFSPSYEPSRRWGGALGWNGRLTPSWIGTITANYSLNQHQSEPYDINFNPVTRFTLASEGDRPVYALPTSIVPSSGAVASTDSRIHPAFARVNELRSDLQSDATQFVFGVSPAPSNGVPGLGITASYRAYYTYSVSRDQFRGFTGTTAGDPRAIEWGDAGLPRHAFQIGGSLRVPGWFNVDAFSRLTSGRRYTPLVNSDINGDGFANDRAFVFDPAKATDPAVAQEIRSILTSGSASAKGCISRQLNTVAARNSCSAPWTQSLNMAISPDLSRYGLAERGSVSLVITNVFAAVDEMMHGSNHLHNWGANLAPDPVLLNVRRFDPASNQFGYDVNPSFGTTTASAALSRLPFVIGIDVRLRLGPDRDVQEIKGFLKPRAADGTAVLNASQIKERLDHDTQNNFDDIVKRAAAVRLSPTQVAALKQMAKEFDRKRDSIYVGLAAYMASLNGHYLTPQAKARWHDDFVAVARNYIVAGPKVRALLSDEQFGALPVSMTGFFDMDEGTFVQLMARTNFGTLLELITGEGID